MGRRVWVVLALAAAGPAAAQGAGGGDRSGGQGSSAAFEQACVDLVQGRTPAGGEQAIDALKSACAGLMDARSQDAVRADQRRRAQAEARSAQAQGGSGGDAGSVQPGVGRGAPQEGQGVAAAFQQAGRELMGGRLTNPTGMREGGPVRNTLFTNPVGYFNGLGVNAELYRSFMPKLSWVAGARYSTTDATNGTATTFGLMAGVDLYAIGQYNAGLRVGPRVELAVGRESFQGSTTYARMGLSGEVGYDFIATNGLSAMIAGGLGGRVAGSDRNDEFQSFTGGEFGPYLKLGLGFSW